MILTKQQAQAVVDAARIASSAGGLARLLFEGALVFHGERNSVSVRSEVGTYPREDYKNLETFKDAYQVGDEKEYKRLAFALLVNQAPEYADLETLRAWRASVAATLPTPTEDDVLQARALRAACGAATSAAFSALREQLPPRTPELMKVQKIAAIESAKRVLRWAEAESDTARNAALVDPKLTEVWQLDEWPVIWANRMLAKMGD